MKWGFKDPSFGDMIRVGLGGIYHVGIYVSDDEVIQFGLAPSMRALLRDSEIEVLSSDIDTFLAGGFLEVAEFDRKEKKKHRSPKEVVAYARSKLGTRGYNILYNNCEHFANECLSGERSCQQADDVRALFRNMPIVDLYIAVLPQQEIGAPLACHARNEEIVAASNPQVKREKYYVWKLLGYALERSFGLKIDTLPFTKAANGSWSTPKAHFSLSHSGNALAVAVSRAPVGVDIESQEAPYRDEMPRRMMTPSELAHFRQLPAEAQKAYFLTLWTAKEAIFKAAHNDAFRPAEIEAASFGCKTIPFTVAGQDYTCSVATNTPERLRIYEGISL